jgi:hypothetical protein
VPVFERDAPDEFEVVDRWAEGFSWRAHPDEEGARTSHAVRCGDGVWLVDPLDAPGIDERIARLGGVAGVAVLSNWHSRDAGAFARRHDVPVSVPAWMTRVPDLVDAPVERFEGSFGGAEGRRSGATDGGDLDGGNDARGAFHVDRVDPLPGWREGVAYREADGTLYTADLLTTIRLVGDERVGLTLPARVSPPRFLADRAVERILVGHGHGVFADAEAALADTLAGARRRLPRALVEHGPDLARGAAAAVLE